MIVKRSHLMTMLTAQVLHSVEGTTGPLQGENRVVPIAVELWSCLVICAFQDLGVWVSKDSPLQIDTFPRFLGSQKSTVHQGSLLNSN